MGLPLAGTLSFDAIIQLAAGLAVVVYFWRDIWGLIMALFNWIFRKPADEKYKNLILPIIIGSIPAVVLGLLLQKYMDTVFRGMTIVAVTLIAGAVLFYFAERSQSHKNHQRDVLKKTLVGATAPDREIFQLENFVSSEKYPMPDSGGISIKKGFIIGLYQCLALVPGFSRSGATISGGLLTGLNREVSVRFSFLLSLPIILGSGLLKLLEVVKSGDLATQGSSIFWASLFAFASGLLAIHFLLKFLKNHSLNWFGAYRIILAIVILICL